MTNSTSGACQKSRPLFMSPWTMVEIALVVRLVVMAFTYSERLDPARDHWTFGWETARVAQSIAMGHGFSSPYPGSSGPTALIPPLYTYIVAGVFKLFGVYSPASALALLTLNNLLSSFTCLPVFMIARDVFGLRAAVLSGWIWALFPYSITLSNICVWETILTTLLLSMAVLATLRLERSSGYFAWAGYGLLWGLAALSSPSALAALPFLGAWIWLRHWRRGDNCTGGATVAALVFLATVAPWIWRCSQTYGRFVAVRSNFGLEVLVGNSDDTSHASNSNVLPGENSAELEKLQRIGEPAYMAEKQEEAKKIIVRDPLRFAVLTLRRILFTWTGVWDFPPRWTLMDTGLPNVLTYSLFTLVAFTGIGFAVRDRRDYLVPLLIPLIFFPTGYYLTHADIRFRHPIDPLIVIFVAYGAISLFGKNREYFSEEIMLHTREFRSESSEIASPARQN
jgi:4-amino-4-deoxy-L-arabinose transferase-like glycosyltransferase